MHEEVWSGPGHVREPTGVRCPVAVTGVQHGGETAPKLRSEPPVFAMVKDRMEDGKGGRMEE